MKFQVMGKNFICYNCETSNNKVAYAINKIGSLGEYYQCELASPQRYSSTRPEF